MIQWNYLLKTIGNKKDENKYNNNMFFGTKEQKNKRTKELQIQRIRFDETTEIYQQFENGPRVMSFSL